MTGAAPPIAAFDFDGTITDRDTLVPFLWRVTGPAAFVRVVATSAGSIRADQPRNALKQSVLRQVFRGRPVDQVRSAGESYSRELAERRVRPAMREQIEWHRELGHRVVVVSASLHVYLDPLAAELGVDEVLAVALEEDGDGRLTGEIVGANTRGPVKLKRLRDWAGGPFGELWVYGDASGDADLLRAATHPMPVTPRAAKVVPT